MVKCKDCGFLSLAFYSSWAPEGYRVGELFGPGKGYRSTGVSEVDGLDSQKPICFVLAHDLERQRRDTQAALSGGLSRVTPAHREDGQSINPNGPLHEWQINVDRLCPTSADGKRLGFTKWQQGFSPKEHREMLDREWLLDREDRRDREQREWQERQEMKTQTFQFKLVLLAGLFALLAAFAGTYYGYSLNRNPNVTVISAPQPAPLAPGTGGSPP